MICRDLCIKFANLMWSIWKVRCMQIYASKAMNPQSVINSVLAMAKSATTGRLLSEVQVITQEAMPHSVDGPCILAGLMDRSMVLNPDQGMWDLSFVLFEGL